MNQTGRRIGSLLSSLPTLKAINVQMAEIAALQRSYAAAVPPNLGRRSRLVRIERQCIVIAAESGAVGAKLRVLRGRILAALQAAQPRLNAVHVEVMVLQRSRPPAAPLRRIGAPGVAALRALAESLPDGSLREVVAMLAVRAQTPPSWGGSDDEDAQDSTNSDREDQSLQSQEGEHQRQHDQ